MRSPQNQGPRLRYAILLLPLLAAFAAAWRLGPQAQPSAPPSIAAHSQRTGLTRVEETGKRLYVTICAYCHGVNGDGFGLNAPNLAVPPRDHTDASYMASRTDKQLFAVIKYGGGAQGRSNLMPPWGGRLSDREIAALVAYLRTLSRTQAKGNDTKH